MKITNLIITEKNQKDVENYINFFYPNHRVVRENEFAVIREDGKVVQNKVDDVLDLGNAIRVKVKSGNDEIELYLSKDVVKNDGISKYLPIYTEGKQCVYVPEAVTFNKYEGVPAAQKVYAFENWEIRGGHVVSRPRGFDGNLNLMRIVAR